MPRSILLITALAGPCVNLYAASKCGSDLAFNPFRGTHVEYRNVIADEAIKAGKTFAANTSLGKLRPRPRPMTPNDDLFQQGQELYAKKDYAGAVKIFLQVYKLDAKNPFVINALSRTYYNMEGQGSRSINGYLELMSIIEAGYFDSEKYSVTIRLSKNKPQAKLVIDPWFIEAYWKLGTLYLDYQEYEKSVFEMSKIYYYEFHAGIELREAEQQMAKQLFGYLAEAHFHLKNKAANNYFICRTKEVDPQNTYVDAFELK